jgi:aminoglycoside phosphotransferase (APT) family kinase protein
MADLEDHLRRWLAEVEPDSHLLTTRRLGGGISSGMTAFAVSGAGRDRTLILRQPNDWTLQNIPHAVRHEFERLGVLQREGIPVPSPVYADETGASFGRPGLIIEYVDGTSDLSPVDLAGYLDQFAHRLATIHKIDPATPGLSLPEPDRGYFERFGTDVPPEADPAFQVERIWAALSHHVSVKSLNPPALLHGDYWPGNTLWQHGALVAVIDWEAAEIGDPLKDLAVSRIDIWWLFGPQAMEDFTASYLAQSPVDLSLLPLWDLHTALRLVDRPEAWAASYVPLGRPDITLDYMKRTHAGFVEQAFTALNGARL